jgi:hypothetical protein
MARQIKLKRGEEFKFSTSGPATRYPWDEWFNGDLLLLEQSEGTKDEKGTVTTVTTKKDYEVDTDAMPPKIKTAACRRYKVVQVSRRDADGNKLVNSLIIKARDMTDDERTAEDIKRAEEKAARAGKDEDEDQDDATA